MVKPTVVPQGLPTVHPGTEPVSLTCLGLVVVVAPNVEVEDVGAGDVDGGSPGALLVTVIGKLRAGPDNPLLINR